MKRHLLLAIALMFASVLGCEEKTKPPRVDTILVLYQDLAVDTEGKFQLESIYNSITAILENDSTYFPVYEKEFELLTFPYIRYWVIGAAYDYGGVPPTYVGVVKVFYNDSTSEVVKVDSTLERQSLKDRSARMIVAAELTKIEAGKRMIDAYLKEGDTGK